MKQLLFLIFGRVPKWAKNISANVIRFVDVIENVTDNDLTKHIVELTPTKIDDKVLTDLRVLLSQMRRDMSVLGTKEIKGGAKLRIGAEILKALDGGKMKIGIYNLIMESLFLKSIK